MKMPREVPIMDYQEGKMVFVDHDYPGGLNNVLAPIVAKELRRYMPNLVEVVRCKDCLIWDAEKYGYGWCKYNARTTHENWFCADGERREE